MAAVTHCFEILLGDKLPRELPEVVVAFGDDAFLRRETTHALLALAGIEADDARFFDGEECEWVDVHDELATLSLFESEGRRIAIVTRADKLITAARPQIEKWCESPAESSLLILQPSTLPSNTKLYKIASKRGWCIGCTLPTSGPRSKTPSMSELKKWIRAWAKLKHDLQVSASQATIILDAVGPDCGLLHQELAKLALYTDDKGKLTDDAIRQHVGTWRTRTMWEIADAVADGRVAEALEQLQHVFASGEHPMAVVPQISWSLRRFGNAAELIMQGQRTGRKLSLQAAISQCGFWGRDVQLAEGRLRRIGSERATQILDWLLELDLKTKGTHSTTSRAIFALEEFCLKFQGDAPKQARQR